MATARHARRKWWGAWWRACDVACVPARHVCAWARVRQRAAQAAQAGWQAHLNDPSVPAEERTLVLGAQDVWGALEHDVQLAAHDKVERRLGHHLALGEAVRRERACEHGKVLLLHVDEEGRRLERLQLQDEGAPAPARHGRWLPRAEP